MTSNAELFRCRVCGLLCDEEPWGPDGKIPTFDYCDCCGVEFGYGDSSPIAIQRWRAKWLDSGAEWAVVEARPEGWNVDAQLAQVPEKYSDVPAALEDGCA